MVEKLHIGAEELLEDSFRLGLQVLDSGFRPTYIVGIWRGGCTPGIAVQELLDFFGVEADHIAIRTSSYTGVNKRDAHVRVHGLHYIVDNIDADDSLLIVDDVYDTGASVGAVIDHINKLCRRNTPKEIRVATVYYKPTRNETQRNPDFYIHEMEHWLVFPHELHGLTVEEIGEKKSGGQIVRARLDRLAKSNVVDLKK
jgi:hypothetical protein